jgi:hypothetical protein
MNERIVKLISEADSHARSIADKYAPDCGQVSYLWEDAFRKKFAELLIRECAELMEKQHSWITNVAASKLIRTHFGVE